MTHRLLYLCIHNVWNGTPKFEHACMFVVVHDCIPFCKIYCRMLNVREHLSWRFGYVWRSRFLNLVSVTSGVLFSYASIISGEFYFSECMEPCETRVIKFSRKLSIYSIKFPETNIFDIRLSLRPSLLQNQTEYLWSVDGHSMYNNINQFIYLNYENKYHNKIRLCSMTRDASVPCNRHLSFMTHVHETRI